MPWSLVSIKSIENSFFNWSSIRSFLALISDCSNGTYEGEISENDIDDIGDVDDDDDYFDSFNSKII